MGDESSEDPEIGPFRPARASNASVRMEVGGPVDEVGVTLAVYGEELEPHEVSRALGVEPTRAHRRGDVRGPRSPPYTSGAWLLTVHGGTNEPAAAVIAQLLAQLPAQPAVWQALGTQHRVQVRFGLYMTGRNKGLSILPEQVARIADLGASLEFDIYACGEDDCP